MNHHNQPHKNRYHTLSSLHHKHIYIYIRFYITLTIPHFINNLSDPNKTYSKAISITQPYQTLAPKCTNLHHYIQHQFRQNPIRKPISSHRKASEKRWKKFQCQIRFSSPKFNYYVSTYIYLVSFFLHLLFYLSAENFFTLCCVFAAAFSLSRIFIFFLSLEFLSVFVKWRVCVIITFLGVWQCF